MWVLPWARTDARALVPLSPVGKVGQLPPVRKDGFVRAVEPLLDPKTRKSGLPDASLEEPFHRTASSRVRVDIGSGERSA